MKFKDYEDAVQSACALRVNADYIITRNIKDFEQSRVSVIKPSEFLKKICNNKKGFVLCLTYSWRGLPLYEGRSDIPRREFKGKEPENTDNALHGRIWG